MIDLPDCMSSDARLFADEGLGCRKIRNKADTGTLHTERQKD